MLGWLCETHWNHVGENRSIALWLQRWRHLSARVYSGRIDAINNHIKSNLLIKRKGQCNQFSYMTYNLSLTIYNKWVEGLSDNNKKMIPIGHIATSQQLKVTCDHDRDFHVASDVRRKLYHTDDVKSEILFVTPCLLTRIREFIHTQPSTARGIAMPSVDKFPYPPKQTRRNGFIACLNDVCCFLKRFRNFKFPAIPFIWPKSLF